MTAPASSRFMSAVISGVSRANQKLRLARSNFSIADNTGAEREPNLPPSISVNAELSPANILAENGDPLHSQIRRTLREVGFGRLHTYESLCIA